MDENNRNFILAIILSLGVLFAWQFFFALPQQQEQQAAQEKVEGRQQTGPQQPDADHSPLVEGEIEGQVSPGPGNTEPQRSREEALAASPRVEIDTPSVHGSISLKGARIDDLTLKRYRVTVDPNSPQVILLSPAGTPHAYYAEEGWVAGPGAKDLALPNADTMWTAEGDGPLTPSSPLTLTYDNGAGLTFTRTVSVDDDYMFTVKETVSNESGEPVTLYRYGLVSRHEMPKTQGFYILHEGLIGVVGEEGLEEISYSEALEDKAAEFNGNSGWLGITDKYWAATVIPQQGTQFKARFTGTGTQEKARFQTDYLSSAVTVQPGSSADVEGRVFAGAKEVGVLDRYAEDYNIPRFDRLIDWGWFYFLTRPMFYALDLVYKLVGNFGVSILIVTVLIKLLLFPLANKSYVSMSRMKKLQPEMMRIKERYSDDRMRQQQEMMALYKKEKVNPAAGCLPILIQIPIFFSLYKVLFITIEMRHAPFFGWIQDLSAPDPTTVFNLFGLIPWDPPSFLMIGIWPLIMGVTMFVQMKLNPAPPDPVQQKVFTWMPVFFTYLLASFPAGLVIYWAWNNTLSVLQQSFIMHRQGVDIPLFENLGIKGGSKAAKDAEKSSGKGSAKNSVKDSAKGESKG